MKQTKTSQDPIALRRRKTPTRSMIQIFFFALIAYFAIGKSIAEINPAWSFLPEISLHSLCPFGGVATLYNLLTDGSYIQKIHTSSVVLSAIVLLLALLFGPVFCGWICPLGTLQDWISRLGKKLLKKRYNRLIPAGVDRVLRYLRYFVLAWVIYMSASTGKLVFESIDPYYALFHFWTSEVAIGGLIILGVTVLLSLVVARPWCKYACPYGALLGLFNKIRIFGIRRKASSCISCGRCTRECPMNLDVATAGVVRDTQCISCYECTSGRSCPVPDTVSFGLPAITDHKAGDKI